MGKVDRQRGPGRLLEKLCQLSAAQGDLETPQRLNADFH